MYIQPITTAFVGIGLASALSAAPQCTPDAVEPNESCAQAALIASGSLAGLTSSPQDVYVFAFEVPAGQRFDALLHLSVPDELFGGVITLYRDDGSADPCDDADNLIGSSCIGGANADASVAWVAPQNAAQRFILSLQTFGVSCAPYGISLTIAPDPCAGLPADAFEPNDTCAGAATLTAGSFTGLNVSVGDPDNFALTLGAGELATLRIDALNTPLHGLLRAWSAGAGCGLPNSASAVSGVFGSFGGMYLFNASSSPRSYIVSFEPQANAFDHSALCAEYSLQVAFELDPCGSDAFEPNDDCASAAPLAASQSGLTTNSVGDFDNYRIAVPANSTLRVRSTSASATRAMHLLRGCSGSTSEFLSASQPYAFAPLETRQWLQWTNTSPLAVDTRLMMLPLSGYPAPFCDVYDLDLGFTLGRPFCIGTLNSTNEIARMSASGSTTVGQGVLELQTTSLPANKNAIVLFGFGQRPPAAFGGGYLCIQAPYVRMGIASTGSGSMSTSIDWTGASAALTSGSSAWFQTWFRDPSAAGAKQNLSEGLQLDLD